MELFAQILGFIALGMAIISFQSNSRKRILLFQLIAGSIFTVHFFLLGAYTGSVLNLLGVLRSAVFYNKGRKWADSVLWLAAFFIASAAICVFTWAGPATLLPSLAMMLTTVAFYVSNTTLIRALNLPSSPMWMIYNILNRSYAGVLTECFVMTSIIVAMIRFDRKKRV